jgi:DNA repair photolyase
VVAAAVSHLGPPTGPAALKGRGTAWAIEHRYARTQCEPFDDGWGTLDQAAVEAPLAPGTQVIEAPAGRLLAANDSPDIGFDLSINPYRGCEHGCIYCYARPTHSWLNLSPGLDFETRIFAKVNASERLRAELAAPAYRPRALNLGSATDAWQPCERRLRITRGIVEVLAECGHPFGAVTKSSGIERDIDLLGPMGRSGLFQAFVSVTTLDDALARVLEPRAAAPARRLRTIERLAAAGIPVTVNVSPVIPFINEPEIERILAAAHAAGAQRASAIVLRLPWEVAPLFRQWLAAHFPDRSDRVMARVRELHGGKDYDAEFGRRMRGRGVWAELISQRVRLAAQRLGMARSAPAVDFSRFKPPAAAAGAATAKAMADPAQAAQGRLFD